MPRHGTGRAPDRPSAPRPRQQSVLPPVSRPPPRWRPVGRSDLTRHSFRAVSPAPKVRTRSTTIVCLPIRTRVMGSNPCPGRPVSPGGRSVGCGSFRGASPALCWPEAGRGSWFPRSMSGVVGFGSAAFSCSGSRPEPPAPPGSRSSSRSGLPDTCPARSRPALRSRKFSSRRSLVSRSIRCSRSPSRRASRAIPWPRSIASVARVR